VLAFPDITTLQPCRGSRGSRTASPTVQPGRIAVRGEPADGAQAGDRAVRRARDAADRRPELEFYVLERTDKNPTGWQRYGEATGNVYVPG
jgi:glutamine synthetase